MHYERPKLVRWRIAHLAIGCALVGNIAEAETAGTPEGIAFFETHIRPVLVEKCYGCHSASAKVLKGGLRLDTAERMRAGGETGPVIAPNDPAGSRLISALKYESNEMPPEGKLADSVIHDFEKWIALGAPDPRKELEGNGSQSANLAPGEHWAYNPPQKSSPPEVRHTAAERNDVDRFVLAKLESAGLSPSTQAEPRALLRRVSYDLSGLPPTADELDAFEADASDANYEAAVERLLSSPRFGERWARHWLDVSRYSDTKGYVFTEDRSYKGAYAYRDWVIASFNADRPYDKFILAQIASDQTGDPSSSAASGFLTLGRRFLNNQHDIINDRIDVVTRGVMGLTVACARCHDHKYDPITAADYYGLYGVFASSKENPREDAPPELVEADKPYEPYVFLRGQAGNRGPKTARRFLPCASPNHEAQPFQHGSGRLEMAEAIVSRANPLTARVWVNRVWGHLFGKGLVDTPSDFGVRGTPPTHPELLDALACDFMDEGWSTKRLIRRIVLSATYRQSSMVRAECSAVDPENRLLWRANRRRLDLEALRDSLLMASGRLDEKMGGPSISLTESPFSTRRSVYGYIERQNLPQFFRTFDFANPNTHTPERAMTTVPQQALFLMNSPFAIEQATYLAARNEVEGREAGGQRNGEPTQPGVAGVVAEASSPLAALHQQSSLSHAESVRRVTRMYRAALGRNPTLEEVTDALDFVDRDDPGKINRLMDRLAWQFGWGAYDETNKTVQFEAFARIIDGRAWQGGPKLPDPALGWAMLNAEGGHPGDSAHCAIRRWVAPVSGTLSVEGLLSHDTDKGDGVRGRVIANRAGVLGSWDARHSEARTKPEPFEVQAADTIDFLCDCRGGVDSDSFRWTVTLRLKPSDGREQVWDSVKGFHGRMLAPLTRWQALAQVLLISNEFVFVD